MSRPSFPHAEVFEPYMPRRFVETREVQVARSVATALELATREAAAATDPPGDGPSALVIMRTELERAASHLQRILERPANRPEPADLSAAELCVYRHGPAALEDRLAAIARPMVAPAPLARVRVNAGKWIVDCPLPGCNGAQVASYDDQRTWCTSCSNRVANGLWLKVMWPEDPAAIEAQLRSRPFIGVMHWNPGETKADLERQDEEAKAGPPAIDPSTFARTTLVHGVEVPVLHYGTPEWEAAQNG